MGPQDSTPERETVATATQAAGKPGAWLLLSFSPLAVLNVAAPLYRRPEGNISYLPQWKQMERGIAHKPNIRFDNCAARKPVGRRFPPSEEAEEGPALLFRYTEATGVAGVEWTRKAQRKDQEIGKMAITTQCKRAQLQHVTGG